MRISDKVYNNIITTKEDSTIIVTFMTPRAGVLVLGCDHLSHIVKMYYFFKNSLLYSHAYIVQTKYMVMMTKEGCTKIVTFMTPGARVLALGCGRISFIVKYIISVKIFFSSQGHRSNILSK